MATCRLLYWYRIGVPFDVPRKYAAHCDALPANSSIHVLNVSIEMSIRIIRRSSIFFFNDTRKV